VDGTTGTASAIEAGAWHSCAIQARTGNVICWGNDDDVYGNYVGQATPPAAVDGTAGTAMAIAAGGGHSLAIRQFGSACRDGFDNDGDGLVDLADPGCADDSDLSERDPALPCDDGVDNDGDGRIDFDLVTFANPGDRYTPPAGSGDPGCHDPSWGTESPECQDGIHNDSDGKMDYDAGFSANGSAHPAGRDPECAGKPWRNRECGLGVELALVLPALMWLRRKRNRRV
jgi:hypothetical protein